MRGSDMDKYDIKTEVSEMILVLLTLAKSPEREDRAGTLRAFVMILTDERATKDEVKQVALRSLKTDTFFPSPARLLEHLEHIRDQKLLGRLSGLVEAINPDGVPVLVHPRQIDGVNFALPAPKTGEIPEGVDRRPSSIMARMSLKALE